MLQGTNQQQTVFRANSARPSLISCSQPKDVAKRSSVNLMFYLEDDQTAAVAFQKVTQNNTV